MRLIVAAAILAAANMATVMGSGYYTTTQNYGQRGGFTTYGSDGYGNDTYLTTTPNHNQGSTTYGTHSGRSVYCTTTYSGGRATTYCN